MPDHFTLKLRIKSVVMFTVGILLIFELQSNLFCFLTPATFQKGFQTTRHIRYAIFLLVKFLVAVRSQYIERAEEYSNMKFV